MRPRSLSNHLLLRSPPDPPIILGNFRERDFDFRPKMAALLRRSTFEASRMPHPSLPSLPSPPVPFKSRCLGPVGVRSDGGGRRVVAVYESFGGGNEDGWQSHSIFIFAANI